MTKADVDTLEAQTPETLAYWWCILNSYDWPEQLGEPPPAAPGVHQEDRSTTIMWWIARRVEMKERLRALNVRHLKAMTNQEFEAWWGKTDGR